MTTRVADESSSLRCDGASSTMSGFSRRDSPDVVRWIDDHAPTGDVVPSTSSAQLNGIVANTAADGIESRGQRVDSDTTSSSSPLTTSAELAEFTEAHTVTHTRTLVCNAPKALLWRVMMRNIKAPPCTNVRNVTVRCEGIDYVYRNMEVRVDHDADEWMVVKEKVTWDESDFAIRSTLYEDEVKEGYVEKAITTDASAHTCVTVSCNWTFKPRPELTPDALAKYRKQLRNAIDVACANTVRVAEEEAKEAALERRKRHHSLTKESAPVHAAAATAAAAVGGRESSKTSPRGHADK